MTPRGSGPDRTTLVVPCYNEAERLDAERYRAALAFEDGLQLLFVDDGSEDDTLARLQRLREERPDRVDVLSLPANRGKAEAVRRGVLRAMDGGADAVGYWDADLATPLDELPRLRSALERFPHVDLVLGSRVQLAGRSIRRSLVRHYAGRVFATLASAVLGLAVYDTQCGAKLVRTSELTRSIFEEPFVSRWIFDVELLARYRRRAPVPFRTGLESPIREVPLREWRDVGVSRIRAVDWLVAPLELARIALRYRASE